MDSNHLKARLDPLQRFLRDSEIADAKQCMAELFSASAQINLCHPFGTVQGKHAFIEHAVALLKDAMPDLERRVMVTLAGTTPEGQHWVGTMGNYMGSFFTPFLGIPPTGHLAHMRFHEFYRFEDNQVVEMQAIWDIPELMMQAGAWPMAPQLGAFLCTPAPMSNDDMTVTGDGSAAEKIVVDMLTDLCKHPQDPDPSIMQLHRYWHKQVNWYGPAGIGTCRGIAGFRHWHQIPFLRGMPDRKLDANADLMSHWVSEGDYVCETGWPNMRLTLSEDGWMGIAPSNTEILLRSLDFWRLQDGLIRENWVLVDLLHAYHQLGVDVLARMEEFNKARNLGPISLSDGLQAIPKK